MRAFAAILLIATSPALFAQSSPALPGCEPRPEVRQVLDEKLSEKILQEMKFTERVAFRRQVLEDLIAKYPREVEPYRRLIQATKEEDTDHYPALVDRYQKQAKQHPDDPLTIYTAGLALSGMDTPQSIRLLEQARSQAPSFVWPALELAHIYSPGTKRVDKKKAGDEVMAFFAACPSSSDAGAQRRLDGAGSSELQARVAAALRARLATETDPKRLKDYKTLWGLEFRTHPPHEHDALRKQVAADLQRLESLNPKPDAGWLVFLKNGYKQSGAPPETVAAMEDRVIQTFPHSDEAYRIVSDRWEKPTRSRKTKRMRQPGLNTTASTERRSKVGSRGLRTRASCSTRRGSKPSMTTPICRRKRAFAQWTIFSRRPRTSHARSDTIFGRRVS